MTATKLPDLRLRVDPAVRRYRDGTVLLGGSPLRLLRLSARAAALLAAWEHGDPVGPTPSAQRLARRLLEAGVVHPVVLPAARLAGLLVDATVVVPVKDNPDGLARLLAGLPAGLRVVVVDDGSAVPVAGADVRHEHPAGPAAARNAGVKLADTEFVVFLDSDVIPRSGWLEALLPLFDDPRVAAAAPRVLAAPGTGWLARYEAGRPSRCPLDLGAEPAPVRPLSRVGYLPAAALAVRTEAFLAAGGFDEDLRYGEDVDLVWRLTETGWTVRYQPESVVTHTTRETLRGWLHQRYSYGTSAAPLAQRHPGNLTPARMSRWTAVTWALAATGHPVAATAVAAATAAALPRKTKRAGLPPQAALTVAARGHVAAGRMLAEAVRRTWWPLALTTRTGRRAVAVSLLPAALEAARQHDLDPLRWAALRVADDVAYSSGVWAGCLRHRTTAPLRPTFAEWPGK